MKPEIAPEVRSLAALRKKHAIEANGSPAGALYPRLSIFGHADPVSTDTYNKILSGRRAAAIYGLLTRDTNIWEHLYSVHEGGDRWGEPAISTALQRLGLTAGATSESGEQTRSAIRKFQASRGLASDGIAGPKTRAVLFREYMDALCGSDFVLDKQDDFLAGTDPGGKGDYQGCGRFNPVLLFSSAEDAEFSRPEMEETRNTENGPNRRVMVLLFRPGARVTAAKWPCPRAKESIAACTKRFWSDAERRRSERLPSQRRLFEETKDTFACRFYQRLTAESPCERASATDVVWIGVPPLANDPIPQAATISIVSSRGDSHERPLQSGFDRGDGLLHFPVFDPKPGVHYSAALRAGPQDDPLTIFDAFELHTYLTRAGNGAAASISGEDAGVADPLAAPVIVRDAVWLAPENNGSGSSDGPIGEDERWEKELETGPLDV